tara:strand:- start:377 stop:739 length:363 start_codon:yes stop_codon:yes gene_type:complete
VKRLAIHPIKESVTTNSPNNMIMKFAQIKPNALRGDPGIAPKLTLDRIVSAVLTIKADASPSEEMMIASEQNAMRFSSRLVSSFPSFPGRLLLLQSVCKCKRWFFACFVMASNPSKGCPS